MYTHVIKQMSRKNNTQNIKISEMEKVKQFFPLELENDESERQFRFRHFQVIMNVNSKFKLSLHLIGAHSKWISC